MKTRLGIILLTLLCAAGSARAQEQWQADLQIRSVSVRQVRERGARGDPGTGGTLVCQVTLYNENDDDARNPTVRILFPVGVRFISSTSGCTPNPTPDPAVGPTHAFAVCNVATMAVGASATVEVTTTVPSSSVTNKTFGAFAWSLSPDPNPRNNYGEGAPSTVVTPSGVRPKP